MVLLPQFEEGQENSPSIVSDLKYNLMVVWWEMHMCLRLFLLFHQNLKQIQIHAQFQSIKTCYCVLRTQHLWPDVFLKIYTRKIVAKLLRLKVKVLKSKFPLHYIYFYYPYGPGNGHSNSSTFFNEMWIFYEPKTDYAMKYTTFLEK